MIYSGKPLVISVPDLQVNLSFRSTIKTTYHIDQDAIPQLDSNHINLELCQTTFLGEIITLISLQKHAYKLIRCVFKSIQN